MWRGKTVSLVLPTYNEKDSIRACIEGFFATGLVDKIVVVNNNAVDGTSAEVARTKAREVIEREQGYGAAIQRGFREARGELVMVCEPDATFDPQDAVKLLAYSYDFDLVLGTRTAKEFIWDGAEMGHFLKWGNFAVAKLMEFLFNTVTLTDVGCTYRVITRAALERMAPHFTVKDNYFGPEMMLLACVLDIPFVQVPVNYRRRVGVSSVTGNKAVAFRLGLRMIRLILAYRWRHGGLRPMPRRARRPGASA
jgi:glycosyltransferase involved in cell wall biosynthesis